MTFISSLEGRGGGRGGGCSGGESPAVLRAQCCIPSLSSDLWLKYRDFTSAGKKCLQQRKRRKTGKISKTASAHLSRELRLWKTQLCFHHLQLRCAALCLHWQILWYMYAWETHAWRLWTDRPAAFVWICATMETKLPQHMEKLSKTVYQKLK